MKKTFGALLVASNLFISGIFGVGGVYVGSQWFLDKEITETVSEAESDVSLTELASVDIELDKIQSISLLSESEEEDTSTLSISEIAATNEDSVVEITTEVVSTNGRMGQYVSEGAGSGVIVSEDGYIVTNNHVIEGASKITVRLNNGAEYIATLVGRDSKTDLAVVKIDETELNSVVFGDSDELIVGELAVAIGNPLGELGGTVTEGIISALDRSIEIDGESMTLLQTSAAINPGNSGGGLFNQYGELIGIVNAKSSGSGIEGLGFAIPINTAEDIIEQIIEYGYVQGRIDLGVTFIDISDSMTALRYRLTSTGVYVQSIDSSTSTTTTNASANLKVGDRIISIDGVEVDTAAEIKVLLEDYKVGDQLIIQVERNRQTVDIRMVLKQANSI